VVIVGLVIASQVFLHESRWSRRHREEEGSIDIDEPHGTGGSSGTGSADDQSGAGEDRPR
jgi:hypothetical protein